MIGDSLAMATKLTIPQRRALANIATYERGRPTRSSWGYAPFRRLVKRRLVTAVGRADGWTRLFITPAGLTALKEQEKGE